MTDKTYFPASRSNIDSFYVMELLYNANKLEANGKKIFHLELGEPEPRTPKKYYKKLLDYLSCRSRDIPLQMGLRV